MYMQYMQSVNGAARGLGALRVIERMWHCALGGFRTCDMYVCASCAECAVCVGTHTWARYRACALVQARRETRALHDRMGVDGD